MSKKGAGLLTDLAHRDSRPFGWPPRKSYRFPPMQPPGLIHARCRIERFLDAPKWEPPHKLKAATVRSLVIPDVPHL